MSTLHPQCEALLRHVARWGEATTVAQARAAEERRLAELAGEGPAVAEVRELTIPPPPGVAAPPLRAVAYRPLEAEPASGVIVWLHGGGWVVGSPAGSDAQTRALAAASGCVVLSVDYRLAPEHRFPAALDDAYAALAWAAAHPGELGAAPGRLAIGGDSAGGNLAAAVTLLARERGGPRIDLQLLVYPVTCRDLAGARSRVEYAEGFWLTQAGMEWYWEQYLADPADAADPHVSPLLADSLAGLPPAHVVLAECDVLHDEGERYANRLAAEGVPVTVRRQVGMLHGFVAVGGVVDAAWDALREAGLAAGEALRA